MDWTHAFRPQKALFILQCLSRTGLPVVNPQLKESYESGPNELVEQGLLSLEMQYFVKETIIYVLVVVF